MVKIRAVSDKVANAVKDRTPAALIRGKGGRIRIGRIKDKAVSGSLGKAAAMTPTTTCSPTRSTYACRGLHSLGTAEGPEYPGPFV